MLANRNMLWASVIVDELARSGVDKAVISPGSRSTPLVMALAQDSRVKTYSIIDERSAAFFALGLALETGKPAALVCSSGTATANFYPAIVEAHYSNVPMIVLTADRPHELRDSGANQTVDQVRMYSGHVLWSVDVALPESNPSELMIRSLRTLANRAVATALGPIRGPVHLNFPLRKPLEPILVPSDNVSIHGSPRPGNQPYTTLSRGSLLPVSEELDKLAALVTQSSRGLIVAGPRTPTSKLSAGLRNFTEKSGYPLLADPLSNLRWSNVQVVGGYETFLAGSNLLDGIELLIHIGALPASKLLEDFFAKNNVSNVVLLTENGVWTDPFHRLTYLMHADAAAVLDGLSERLDEQVVDPDWADRWRAAEEKTRSALRAFRPHAFFDGGIVGLIADMMPDNGRLFVASSLPVRHLEQYGMPDTRKIHVYCNRGASGIDGTVSSAFGVAAATPQPTVLLTGDLAFYHDLNGLMAAKRTDARLIVVVINNDGGGIFKRLPIADFEPQFTELFLTPHGLSFEPAALLYGLGYSRVLDYESVALAFQAALASTRSEIIEVRTEAESDATIRDALTKRILESLADS